MVARRVPLQVSPEFRIRIQKLKGKVLQDGKKEISIRELTERMAEDGIFEDIEKKILNGADVDLKIRFDGRRR